LGGALTPVVATAVAGRGEGPPWGVAAYLTAVALLSLGCFALLPETRPGELRAPRARAVMERG
ncbi:MFS transporter, partial [Streptomyces sp. GC420]|nr:MFS transporter [Streptomyces sp. GC420]